MTPHPFAGSICLDAARKRPTFRKSPPTYPSLHSPTFTHPASPRGWIHSCRNLAPTASPVLFPFCLYIRIPHGSGLQIHGWHLGSTSRWMLHLKDGAELGRRVRQHGQWVYGLAPLSGACSARYIKERSSSLAFRNGSVLRFLFLHCVDRLSYLITLFFLFCLVYLHYKRVSCSAG